MASSLRPQKVVVVGAGPVGALAALYAAERGDDVELYELRGDLRDASTIPLNFTKSINLAVSERGIHALRSASKIGLVDSIMHDTLPMYGRMIHGSKNGHFTETSQAYDVHGQAIYAADRSVVNRRLLDALDAMPNVKFFFNHKLTGADLKRKKAWFERRSVKDASGRRKSAQPNLDEDRYPELEVAFDLMIGADGAHSATRYHMMKFARVSYQQEYIDALWCEFHITARDGDFALSPNHLHIWPGRRFMFIAIPSTDKSFTCTLFAPQSTFSELDAAPDSLESFFKTNFPGVYDRLIPAEELRRQYTQNPHLPLISIKCFPYHFDASCVILGDAAHAMVPFYGQGMNCGLEDVRVLFEFLDAAGIYSSTTEAQRTELRKEALIRYTAQRSPDAATMNDLALENYWVMRSGVTSPVYKLQKYVEELVTKYVPGLGFRTEYNRVSFGNERYSRVKEAVKRQEGIELMAIAVAGTGVLGLLGWMVMNLRREHAGGLWRGGFSLRWLGDLWR